MAYLKEEIKAGVIILAGFVILSGFTILIGGTGFFEKFDVYYIKLMNVSGLETGSQVRLGGVRVGSVTEIKIPEGPGKPLTVTIGLNKGMVIYKGTMAIISQMGFVGDMYLLLSVKDVKEETGHIGVGEVIPSIEGTDIKMLLAQAEDIPELLRSLIKDIDKLFSQSNIDDIEQLVKKITLVLDEIRLLVKDDKGGIRQMVNSATETIEKAGDLIGSLEKTAGTIDDTSESVKSAVDLQSQNISDLLAIMTETAEDLQEVLQEIKNKPWSLIYREKQGKYE